MDSLYTFLMELGGDSKTLGAWIGHCITKHVKGNVKPKMKESQCVAAGHRLLEAGKLTRGSDSDFIYSAALDSWIDIRMDEEKESAGRYGSSAG
jgi:hypothetical protein